MILLFPRSFSEYSANFSSKFQRILLKINTFSNFCCSFLTVSQALIAILSSFSANSSNFFLQIKSAQIFILVYLKTFLQFSKMI